MNVSTTATVTPRIMQYFNYSIKEISSSFAVCVTTSSKDKKKNKKVSHHKQTESFNYASELLFSTYLSIAFWLAI